MKLSIRFDHAKALKNGVKKFIKNLDISKYLALKEYKVLSLLSFLFLVLIVRLFSFQIINAKEYRLQLINQHYRQSFLQAERGKIYIQDKAWKDISLTENIKVFDLFVDPYFVKDKKRLIKIITPLVYEALCQKDEYWLDISSRECILNLEDFTRAQILPYENEATAQEGIIWEDVINKFLQEFNTGFAYTLISKRLEDLIKIGKRDLNYLAFVDDQNLLNSLKQSWFVEVKNNYYVYINPFKVDWDVEQISQHIYNLFQKYGYTDVSLKMVKNALLPQDIRYIKLLKNINADIAKKIRKLKKDYSNEYVDGVPLLHWLWLEENLKRFYPLWEFASNVIGFLDGEGRAFYGVEAYFDDLLQWRKGKVAGLSTPWIGAVGTTSLEIQSPVNGADIYLTLDYTIQRELEKIAREYFSKFKADSVSILVLDPANGKVVADVNYPSFDGNFYKDVYKIVPLSGDLEFLVEDDSYIDIPVLVYTGSVLKKATYAQRKDPFLKKYVYQNIFGPFVFLDRNISVEYEPGSTFKTITTAIWLDIDAIDLYDRYYDKGYAKVGPYTIKNVHEQCKWTNSYLHALQRSCNVWMIKIVQKITKWGFYNYLQRLGFGQKTGIQLAGEKSWQLPNVGELSKARLFNNSFGQGILATPLQMASAYATLVNWGYKIQPTIVSKICYKDERGCVEYVPKKGERIFRKSTSEKIKDALYQVMQNGDLRKLKIPGYSLGGKTGTTQIAFKGKYQSGEGRTIWSFVGIVTKNNLKYVVVVQVRRPRTTQWWVSTAGEIFKKTAQFLIEYSWIRN